MANFLQKMSAQKRKRTDLTLDQKKEIIDAAKRKSKQSELARRFTNQWGFEVKRTTVIGILAMKDSIEAAILAGVPSKRKKLTSAHDPRLDEAVLKWLKQARGQNLPISGDLIKVSF
jgi:hypothetical protein